MPKRKTKSGRIFFIIIFLLLGVFSLRWYYKFSIINPIDPANNQKINFSISSGRSVKEIARDLKKKGLIRNKRVFYYYVTTNNLDTSIKAGNFILNSGMNMIEIAENLTGKVQAEISFLIPEGFTIKDIDKKLAETGVIGEGEFIGATRNYSKKSQFEFLNGASSLEGYLFPDTYFVNTQTFQADLFIDRLLKNFAAKALPELKKSLAASGRSMSEIIIMASIIEKEVKTAKDRPIVSGILWKRLDAGWMLGADATLLYEKNQKTLSAKDLDRDSPYNTRKYKGLPPTAIGNPGLASIEASLNPQSSKYWYYLTPPNSDQVIYSATNEEHNENKQKYL